ncbi:hypothetical protein J43TS3_21510 [Ornithinibacillus bavariensis]|uniref:Uncharacterized protein n=1 Tax=Ornithinibacillus bavariensis TaxID=545502 RepID=A0A919XAK1_9BACI|nr:hypothetical protein J43TS3_21510 [Ornithinibacillus bavariensis]
MNVFPIILKDYGESLNEGRFKRLKKKHRINSVLQKGDYNSGSS